jgi:hypothetical protein
MIIEPIINLPITGSLLEDAKLIRCAIDNDTNEVEQIIHLVFLQDEGFKAYLGEDTEENLAWTKLEEYISSH